MIVTAVVTELEGSMVCNMFNANGFTSSFTVGDYGSREKTRQITMDYLTEKAQREGLEIGFIQIEELLN